MILGSESGEIYNRAIAMIFPRGIIVGVSRFFLRLERAQHDLRLVGPWTETDLCLPSGRVVFVHAAISGLVGPPLRSTHFRK